MSRTLALAAFLALIVLPASAQQSPKPSSTPGIWYDITKTPLPEGRYGMGFSSTKRVLERCTALLWTIRTDKSGDVRRYRRDYQSGYCLGWINSTMAFLNFHNEAGEHTLGVCMPEDLDSKSVIETFIKYVQNNREHMIYNPSLLIYWALLEKYPCKK